MSKSIDEGENAVLDESEIQSGSKGAPFLFPHQDTSVWKPDDYLMIVFFED